MMKIIEAKKILKQFGGIKALNNLDLFVRKGEIVGLIGPNGSGKTTFFNCLTGFYKVDDGVILFKNTDITNKSTHIIIQKGISRTFQLNRIFPNLTVLQNVLLGQNHYKERIFNTAFKKSQNEIVEKAIKLLEFVKLNNKKNELAGHLSFGQQKLLDLAIALVKEPELLLLDEPTAGVNPTLIRETVDYIKKINDNGTSILLIEHNMDVVMNISNRIYVLSFGKKIAEGTSDEIRKNPSVLDIYFGK